MSVDYDPVAAGHGRFVPDPKRWGVLIWKPELPQSVDLWDLDRGPVVCRCGARATETCRTANGNRTKDHVYRASPRVCPCGAAVKWKGRLCRECREERAAEQRRAWKAARREVAA